jgi:hypothetical protein
MLGIEDVERANLLIKASAGKRLTYRRTYDASEAKGPTPACVALSCKNPKESMTGEK